MANQHSQGFIGPSLFYCDDAYARYITIISSFHDCAKHIDLDFHIVRGKLLLDLFQLLPVSSSQQVTNIFTKPLDLSCSPLISLGLVFTPSTPTLWGVL